MFKIKMQKVEKITKMLGLGVRINVTLPLLYF